jgi:hypothetical protein
MCGSREPGKEERVPTDKDKGLIGSASDQLKETTGVLKGQGPWHSANSDVYHNNPNCQTGNSISAENVQQGTGGKPLCGECEKLNSAGGTVGNLTGL